MNTIKIYLISRDDRNNLLEGNNDIVVPLAHEVVKSLFGWLSKNTDLPKNKLNEEEHDDEENDDADVGRMHLQTIVQQSRTPVSKVIRVLSCSTTGKKDNR
jgi:hypothetical protein